MKTLPLACLLAAIAASLPAAAADSADVERQQLFKIDQDLLGLIDLQQHAADRAAVCVFDGRQYSEGAVLDGRICQSGDGRLAWVPYAPGLK
jgi:hypothetical protein